MISGSILLGGREPANAPWPQSGLVSPEDSDGVPVHNGILRGEGFLILGIAPARARRGGILPVVRSGIRGKAQRLQIVGVLRACQGSSA